MNLNTSSRKRKSRVGLIKLLRQSGAFFYFNPLAEYVPEVSLRVAGEP
ncbi:hypothetical protein PYCH_05680 [Pyrococcus yayanosii CH1]|uniref:Uncharacterized protein n=1 Tax=Pyrococcus yayanosii (strain CH1 / JCM 16557) TaxID=529709 RepID=F8AIT2_PYRYC|nr:hypothetical protein PYCH_05680 [Pyrococcus yayanosii CH1]